LKNGKIFFARRSPTAIIFLINTGCAAAFFFLISKQNYRVFSYLYNQLCGYCPRANFDEVTVKA
jgi:hypothetical protein